MHEAVTAKKLDHKKYVEWSDSKGIGHNQKSKFHEALILYFIAKAKLKKNGTTFEEYLNDDAAFGNLRFSKVKVESYLDTAFSAPAQQSAHK